MKKRYFGFLLIVCAVGSYYYFYDYLRFWNINWENPNSIGPLRMRYELFQNNVRKLSYDMNKYYVVKKWKLQNSTDKTIVNPRIFSDKTGPLINTYDISKKLNEGFSLTRRAERVFWFYHTMISHGYEYIADPEAIDPLYAINDSSYGFCSNQNQILAQLFLLAGFKMARSQFAFHSATEVYYNKDWHYFDIWMAHYFKNKGSVPSAQDIFKMDNRYYLATNPDGRCSFEGFYDTYVRNFPKTVAPSKFQDANYFHTIKARSMEIHVPPGFELIYEPLGTLTQKENIHGYYNTFGKFYEWLDKNDIHGIYGIVTLSGKLPKGESTAEFSLGHSVGRIKISSKEKNYYYLNLDDAQKKEFGVEKVRIGKFGDLDMRDLFNAKVTLSERDKFKFEIIEDKVRLDCSKFNIFDEYLVTFAGKDRSLPLKAGIITKCENGRAHLISRNIALDELKTYEIVIPGDFTRSLRKVSISADNPFSGEEEIRIIGEYNPSIIPEIGDSKEVLVGSETMPIDQIVSYEAEELKAKEGELSINFENKTAYANRTSYILIDVCSEKENAFYPIKIDGLDSEDRVRRIRVDNDSPNKKADYDENLRLDYDGCARFKLSSPKEGPRKIVFSSPLLTGKPIEQDIEFIKEP